MAEEEVVLPRFFKLFLSATSSESFAIPMSFMEHLHDPLPKTAKLQGTGGGVWKVSFAKIRDRAFFTEGWSKFAEDHNLQNGEFLTLVYDGHRTFEVSVYNIYGCKETRAVAEVVQLSDSDSEDEDPEEEEEIFIFSLNSQETETTDAPVFVGSSSSVEVNTNPCFDTNLKNRTYELLIPATVVKDYRLTFGDSINYIDGQGIFVGHRGNWKDERVVFKGWDSICRRNRLKDDDTVKCELLRTGKFVHSVRIHVIHGLLE